MTAVYSTTDGQRAVKTLTGAPGLEAQSGQPAGALWMLESAHDQGELAAQCGPGWAPIHDFGSQDGKAYLVSDRFASSLDDLIAPGRRTDPNLLRHIFLELAKALAQAERLMGRAHGNLKPTNVLIDGLSPSNFAAARVCLSDPMPASQLRRRSARLQDRQDFGRLIVAVVTGRPTMDAGAWPVPFDETWSRLGTVGEGWRSLASDLLHPAPEGGPMDWDEVVRRAELLIPPKEKKRRWPYVAAVAAVLLLAGGLGAFFYLDKGPTTAPATFDELVVLAREYNNWAGTAQTQIKATSGKNAPFAKYVNETPELAKAFDGRLRGQASQPLSPDKMLGQDARFFTKLLDIAYDQENNPSEEVQQQVDEIAAILENDKPAARRATLALKAVLETKEALEAHIEAIDKQVSEGPTLNEDAAALIDLYAENARAGLTDPQVSVVESVQQLDSAGDALVDLQGVLKVLADASKQGGEQDLFVATLRRELEEGLAKLAEDQAQPDVQPILALVERGQSMQQAATSIADRKFIHYPSFIKLHRDLYERAAGGVTPALMQSWRDAVMDTDGGAHVPKAPDPRVDWKIAYKNEDNKKQTKTIDQMATDREKQIAQLRELGSDDKAAAAKQTLKEIRQLVEQTRSGGGNTLTWINGNVERIQTQKAAADRRMLALRLNCVEWIIVASRNWSEEVANLRSLPTDRLNSPGEAIAHYFNVPDGFAFSDSQAIRDGWKGLLAKAVEATEQDKKAMFLQNAVKHAVEQLVQIDRGLDAGAFDNVFDKDIKLAGWDRQKTYDTFWEQREAAIRLLVEDAKSRPLRLRLSLDTPEVSDNSAATKIVKAQADLVKWVDQARRVIDDYREIDVFFQAFYTPSEIVKPSAERDAQSLSAFYDSAQEAAKNQQINGSLTQVDQRLGLTRDLLSPDITQSSKQQAVLKALGAQPGAELRRLLEKTAMENQDAAVRAASVIARLRLQDAADPTEIDNLIALRKVYQSLVDQPENPAIAAHKQTILMRYEADLSRAWQRSLGLAGGYETLVKLAEQYQAIDAGSDAKALNPDQPRIGPVANKLTPATKVNLYFVLFQQVSAKIMQAHQDDLEAQEQAFIKLADDMLARMTPYRDADAALASLLTRVRKAVELKKSNKQQVIAEAVGPEAKWLKALGIGVKLLENAAGDPEDLRRYEFSYKGGKQILNFRLVKPAELGLDDSAPNAYLSTSEVPAKFLIDILNTADVNNTFSTIAKIKDQVPVSPIWATDINGNKIVFRDWALDPAGAKSPWVCVENNNKNTFVAQATQGINEPITELHPMQNINPSAAYYFARLLGCRLPTDKEWRAALKIAGDTGVKPNLRDQTWQDEHERLKKINAGLTKVPDFWSTTGTFSETFRILGRDIKVAGGSAALPGVKGLRDGYVWPRAVNPQSKDFVDLIGNVAEWVVTDTGEIKGGSIKLPETKPDENEVKTYFDGRWKNDQIGIIGNSAISCNRSTGSEELVIKSKSMIPTPMAKYGGHMDVGFRLAFTVGQPSLSATMRSLLKDPRYLLPDPP